MTKEQLLIPRYMCTGTPGKPLWPGSLLMSGDILTARFDNYGEDYYYTASCDSRYGKELKEFPHLFRPMPWWEGRQPEDMPKYVSSIALYKDFHIVEVSNHYIKHFIGKKDGQYWEAPYDEYLPATEQEYIEYISR